MKKKIFTMLALLLTAASGAWAQTAFIMKEVTADMVPTTWNGDETTITVDDLPGFISVDMDAAKAWTGAPSDAYVTILYSVDGTWFSELNYNKGNGPSEGGGSYERRHFYYRIYNPGYKIYYTAVDPDAIEVTPVAEPAANTKQWTFTQPASDVVLTPIYAPVAQWATESDVELLPTAAEGIIAGTTDPIIVEGTVAPGQGIVMYAVTSTNQATAPELSAFSATVPTAENIADEGADVLVWYYIQGADTPDGQEATAENTFNDSEICATPLEVSVLSNQFDITFNAANANTIESGKATVTVGGTAATVTEGKLEGVKMGSEVKMTAKEGYKFRKVEAKKAGPAVLAPALENGATVVIICNWGYGGTTTFTYTNNGGTFSGQASGYDAFYFNNGLEQNGKNLSFGTWNVDNADGLSVGITFNTESSAYSYTGKGGDFVSFTISVNGTDVTSQLAEVVNEVVDEGGDETGD